MGKCIESQPLAAISPQDLILEVATKLGWSIEKLKDTIPLTPEILNIFDSAGLRWVNITTPDVLISLRPITHPKFQNVFESESLWYSVKIDIAAEITFHFYWSDGFLCWER